MTTLLVRGGDVYTPFEVISGGVVFARDGVIERVGLSAEVAGPADLTVDAAGRIVCPGFIDLQVNGGGGALLTGEPGRDALERMAAAHAGFGTTAMLATVVTSPEETLTRALEAVRDAVAEPPPGARVLGAHVEGPFINPKRRGVHDERFILPADVRLLERLVAAGGGSLRVITLAPEMPGALDLIVAARGQGVAISIGHTEATYEEAMAAIDAGAKLATHLFNGMRPLHHRDPGVVGAVLRSDDLVTGIIADGIHVDPALLNLVFRAKGADGVTLVTDAMAPAGTDATSFEVYGEAGTVRDGACYTRDGVLAGSALTMNRAVRFMRDDAGVPLLDAVRMATATPASVLGRDDLGALRPGAPADIVVCDEELNVERVFIDGEEVRSSAG